MTALKNAHRLALLLNIHSIYADCDTTSSVGPSGSNERSAAEALLHIAVEVQILLTM